MRKLTAREKIGVVVVIIAAIAALYRFGILDPAKFGFTGGELSAKRAELESTENLIAFDKLASEVEDDIMDEVGMQSNLIPEPLFERIRDKLSVEKLNQAKTPNDFSKIDPMLRSRAGAIFAYRKQIGGFEKIEQIKEIKCSIFEAEPAQAVISRQISELAQKAGINQKYQLGIKPLSGKKRESISIQNRQRLVDKLYRHELEQERDSLKDQLAAKTELRPSEDDQSVDEDVEENAENPEVAEVDNDDNQLTNGDADGEMETPEVDEVDDNNDDGEVDNNDDDRLVDEDGEMETENPEVAEVDDGRSEVEEKKIDRKFPPLPEEIPIETRIELAQVLLSSNYLIKKQLVSNAQLKELLDEFQMPEDERSLNLKPFMSNYVKQVDKSQKELIDWLKATPTSYSKQAYYVEMLSVKGQLEQLVKFIHSIESSSRFFKIRDFQLTIADKQKTTLNANIKIVATVL